jgi:hypothetical protein
MTSPFQTGLTLRCGIRNRLEPDATTGALEICRQQRLGRRTPAILQANDSDDARCELRPRRSATALYGPIEAARSP